MRGQRHELRVLAVDDDPWVRLLFVEVLAHANCRVLTASHGAEAVKILKEEPMDLLITDYEMPVMNGLELLRWSKAHFPRLTAIMITGRDDQTTEADGKACGALRVLCKPFSVKEILSLLGEIRGTPPA